jgi:hypothetical protein
MVKNQRELHRETARLHDQLDDDDVIDLTALRLFCKDLDDYAIAGNTLDPRKLAQLDQQIMTANTTRRQLAVSLSDLAKSL